MRTANRSIIFFLCVVALVAITNDAAAQAGGRISGKVEDQAGNPIEGVQVTAISPSLESFKIEKTTNKKGKFVLAFTDSTHPMWSNSKRRATRPSWRRSTRFRDRRGWSSMSSSRHRVTSRRRPRRPR